MKPDLEAKVKAAIRWAIALLARQQKKEQAELAKLAPTNEECQKLLEL